LLQGGILLHRQETNFVVQLYKKEDVMDREQMDNLSSLNNPSLEYLVYAEEETVENFEVLFIVQKIKNGEPQIDLMECSRIYLESSIYSLIPKDHKA
jgi:hypothetical protein